MAYESYPNVGHNNRAVSSAEYEKMAVPLGLSGLVDYSGTQPILADSSGRQVKLRAGVSASIRGSRFVNTSETIVSLAANGTGNPRIDLVVLRLSRSNWEITPVVIQGVAASTPVAPSAIRNTIDGVGGYWDLPLAEVRVSAGATTIAAGDLTHRAWWINGGGYISFTDGRPPAEPGVTWLETSTGIHWIGTTGGTYRRLASNTGLINLSPPSGWSGTLTFARVGELVLMSSNVRRTGASLPNTTSPQMAAITAAYRPEATWYGMYHCTTPGHSSEFRVEPTGAVIFGGTQNSDGITSGAYCFGSGVWPAATA